MDKKLAYIKWWIVIFPIGIIATITSPFIYVFAQLIEYVLPNKNPLWWWLDDEIEDINKNSDWLEYKIDKPKWIRYYLWHSFRNNMWNLKASFKPKTTRIHCVSNDEKIVEVIKNTMVRNGNPIHADALCLEMPVVRWIDKNGNSSWNTLSGIKVNEEKTVWGELDMWYKVGGKLYFRKGFVREKIGWTFKKKFPFIHKDYYYHIVAKGCNEKRYIYTNKRQFINK